MVATINNYDYFQDYVFRQDGRLRIRLILQVDAAKGSFRGPHRPSRRV